MNLKGKRLALVCPKFYGYEELIAKELQDRGAIVFLIYENIEWVKFSYRFVYVYLTKFKEKLLRSYYERELKDIIHSLDYFIVIRGSSLSPEIMEKIKDGAPSGCKFLMYQWDGVRNNNVALYIAPYFDCISTFDQGDSEQLGWNYRPLFYIPEYVDPKVRKDIDILFICALHSNRASVLNQLKVIAAEKGYNLRTVVHLNKFLYYKYKYINKKTEVLDTDDRDLTFKPLTIEESYGLYSRSKMVIDYTNVNQTGFTMRTIESLGNKCKLITNNPRIKSADFYDEKNIYIYDENDLTIPNSFVSTPFEPISEKIVEKYSLPMWVDDLLGGVK